MRKLDRHVRHSENLVLLSKDYIWQSCQSQARVHNNGPVQGLYRSAGAHVLLDGLRPADFSPSFAGLWLTLVLSHWVELNFQNS